ncbi:MAG: Gfo/Idh/MocA family oxidoreductase [Planctomycetes bacterium]|nr:Gfo/Idh/MocA family oxidoreductase [Planctomycetota bacterium]
MPSKTRVVVVGAGAIAQRRHLIEFKARQDVELLAIVDINAQRARDVAAHFGAPHAMTEFKDALALKPDAVSVCTPNYLHAPQTIAALKAGAHVLCEKPMAISVAETRAMIRAARTARKQLMIAHNQRFVPAHARAREILASRELGKVVAFSTSFAHGGPEGWSVDGEKGFFFKKNEAVLGAMGDLGVHKLDLIRYILGDEVSQIGAAVATLAKPRCGVDDTAFATMAMASGALGQMFAGWIHTSPGATNATIVYCQKGQLHLMDHPDYPLVIRRRGGETAHVTLPKVSNSGVVDAFVDAIRSGRPNPIPGEDGARSLAAVMACMESARTGRFVKPAKIA